MHLSADYTEALPRVRAAQIASSFAGFIASCALMYWLAGHSYWLALPLAPLAAGFLVRIFIIQHDCGHGAFFRARRANDMLGALCSLITLAPYAFWKRQHAGHHGNWNNLDRRSSGLDIYSSCLTLSEYGAMTPRSRRAYRLMRNPVVANFLLPPFVFICLYRVPFDTPRRWRSERLTVYVTDAALIALFVALGMALGFARVAILQTAVMTIAAIVGVWLFSIQHRFEKTSWMREGLWSTDEAALQGSSYLRLPSILQWFTGNIGFHHIHHLNPRIPNYRLAKCHRDNAGLLSQTQVLSLADGLRAWRYALWDEELQKMVPFPQA